EPHRVTEYAKLPAHTVFPVGQIFSFASRKFQYLHRSTSYPAQIQLASLWQRSCFRATEQRWEEVMLSMHIDNINEEVMLSMHIDNINEEVMLSMHIDNINNDLAVVECEGRIVGSEAFRLREAVTSQTEARIVVLDLSEVYAIAGGGLGMLVYLQQWTRDHGIQFKLFNPSRS